MLFAPMRLMALIFCLLYFLPASAECPDGQIEIPPTSSLTTNVLPGKTLGAGNGITGSYPGYWLGSMEQVCHMIGYLTDHEWVVKYDPSWQAAWGWSLDPDGDGQYYGPDYCVTDSWPSNATTLRFAPINICSTGSEGLAIPQQLPINQTPSSWYSTSLNYCQVSYCPYGEACAPACGCASGGKLTASGSCVSPADKGAGPACQDPQESSNQPPSWSTSP